MGLLYGQARYVARMIQQNNITGRAISLGRQDVFIPLERFYNFCEEINVAKIDDGNIVFYDSTVGELVNNVIQQGEFVNKTFSDFVSDRLFYASLGIATIESVDISSHEGATHIFDMNDKDILRKISTTYDLVIDSGTMEHVFDVRNTFNHITDLASVGGHVIHIMPGNNTFDHGFYQFSPTLFRDYYKYNNYEILDVSIMEFLRNPYHSPLNSVQDFLSAYAQYREWPYDDKVFNMTRLFPGPSFGGLTAGVFFSCTCVQKKPDSYRDRPPLQRMFFPY